MPGWLPPARQNFCRSNALGIPLISIMPGQLLELKGERGSAGRPFPFQEFPCKTRGWPCAAPGFMFFLYRAAR